MSLRQKEQLADEIFLEQPNLLASVIVQKKLGVSYEKMDFLIDILLVCYQAMKNTELHWPLISEDTQDYEMTREMSVMKYFENSDAASRNRFATRYIERFPERELLAFVLSKVDQWLAHLKQERREEQSDKYVVMAATNLVSCIAHSAPQSHG